MDDNSGSSFGNKLNTKEETRRTSTYRLHVYEVETERSFLNSAAALKLLNQKISTRYTQDLNITNLRRSDAFFAEYLKT
jgi:hypothetical protein